MSPRFCGGLHRGGLPPAAVAGLAATTRRAPLLRALLCPHRHRVHLLPWWTQPPLLMQCQLHHLLCTHL